jgi:hypothetical protein
MVTRSGGSLGRICAGELRVARPGDDVAADGTSGLLALNLLIIAVMIPHSPSTFDTSGRRCHIRAPHSPEETLQVDIGRSSVPATSPPLAEARAR